ncbi:MAG: Two-component response regulator [Candidatus Saccharibacteria bacterium]|nr:Two-component response regulator [Candidatus Saccharibacteria bacterium]
MGKTNTFNEFNEKRYSVEMPVDGVDKPRIDFILSNIPDSKLKVLDLGCWDGSYASRYKKKTNKVYGVESSVTAAKQAEKKGIEVSQGDFMEITPFPKEKFDIVIAGEIIEHVFDTDLFIQKIADQLKDGGTLVITTPNVASLPRRIMLMLGINPVLENRVIVDVTAGHIRYFTFAELHKLLEDHGFEILKSRSDVVNFNNRGTLFTTLIPKLYKRFGRAIMLVAKKKATA